MQNELTDALVAQGKANLERQIQAQNTYGTLINWRSDKIDNTRHRAKVLSGHRKIMTLLSRSV